MSWDNTGQYWGWKAFRVRGACLFLCSCCGFYDCSFSWFNGAFVVLWLSCIVTVGVVRDLVVGSGQGSGPGWDEAEEWCPYRVSRSCWSDGAADSACTWRTWFSGYAEYPARRRRPTIQVINQSNPSIHWSPVNHSAIQSIHPSIHLSVHRSPINYW